MTAARLAWWTATVGLAIVLAPRVDPLVAHEAAAVPIGICAGAMLFAALARTRVSPVALANVPRGRLLARSIALTLEDTLGERGVAACGARRIPGEPAAS